MGHERRRLGEILVEDHHLRREHLDIALRQQRPEERGRLRETGERVGAMLVRLGALSPRDLATALARQLEIPVIVGLPRLTIPEEVLGLVPLRVAERRLVVPIELAAASLPQLVLAMADPLDDEAVTALEGLCNLRVQRVVAEEEEVRRALKVFYLREEGHRDLGEITDSFEGIRRRLLGAVPIDPDGAGSTAA